MSFSRLKNDIIAMIFGLEVPFFGSGFVGGLWLPFIGWFLNTAASQSYRKVVVNDILKDVPVSELMRQLPVIESGRLMGLLRRRDILKWLQLQGKT